MRHSIYIKHNPFTVETQFVIDGEELQDSKLEAWQHQRLQLWVEELFPFVIKNVFGGDANLDVTFEGVQADYLDIESAMKQANIQGCNISLSWKQAKESSTRLSEIQSLIEEAEQNPLFGDKLKNSHEIRENLKASFNKDFDVYVAATMSSGKSTLINAMLGADLLPAANEATTATIAQITDVESMPIGEFVGVRYTKDGQAANTEQPVDLEVLREWNSLPDTKVIKLQGNIVGIQEREEVRLVITDTPGPNNSQDPEHSKTTMSYIQDSKRNPLILYILNATQLGTEDDKRVLTKIAEIMHEGGKQSKDRFIFVVNKMDAFDPENGEDVGRALERVRAYLEDNGIDNPLIYPVSANLTRLLRKQANNPDGLTRKERGDLNGMVDLFEEEPSMDLPSYMNLSTSVKQKLEQKGLSRVLVRSGLPAIEAMIDEYIDKYNVPNRVNRAYQALNKAVAESSNEHELNTQLAANLEQLDSIEAELKKLANSKEMAGKVRAQIEKRIQGGKARELYPSEILQKLGKKNGDVRTLIANFQEDFYGEGSKADAKKRLNRLERNIQRESDILMNDLENIFEEAQEHTAKKLQSVFHEMIQDLFDDLELPAPMLKSLSERVGNIASTTGLGLYLRDDEVETKTWTEQVDRKEIRTRREKVGEKKVGSWNPFTLFRKKVDVYDDVDYEVTVTVDVEKSQEYVDLDALWDERSFEILDYFNKMIDQTHIEIEKDVETYAKEFTTFMESEFTVRVKEISDELTGKLGNKKELLRQKDEAEQKLAQIAAFKARIEKVLEV